MPTQVIQCQFCHQPMQLPDVNSGQSVCCPSCNRVQDLPDQTSPNQPRNRFKPPPKTMPCPSCGEHFGFTAEMVGHAVACPFCKKQVSVTGDLPAATSNPLPGAAEESHSPGGAVESIEFQEVDSVENELPPSKESAENSPEQIAEQQAAQQVDQALLDKWLPPTFGLGSDERFATPSQKSRALDINTNITRIQVSDERVPVRTITRQEKEKRRRIRVLCVFSISIIWLVIFFWLMA